MDLLDSACALEAKQTEMALAMHFKMRTKAPLVNSASECLECGNAIPAARQQSVVGCQYCTSCQTLIEQGKL